MKVVSTMCYLPLVTVRRGWLGSVVGEASNNALKAATGTAGWPGTSGMGNTCALLKLCTVLDYQTTMSNPREGGKKISPWQVWWVGWTDVMMKGQGYSASACRRRWRPETPSWLTPACRGSWQAHRVDEGEVEWWAAGGEKEVCMDTSAVFSKQVTGKLWRAAASPRCWCRNLTPEM